MATLRGSQQNDTLRGGDADDRIFGLAGADLLFGGGGNDRIDGGAGADRIVGGAGNDQLFGGAGRDRIEGGDGADQIRGQGDRDVLIGGRGDDVIFGNGGGDQLIGGPGADHLDGGPGADRLSGGPGIDTLTGGPGADRFIFGAAGEGPDRITDFNPAEGDSLRMTGALAGAAVRLVDDGSSTTVQVKTTAAEAFTDLAVLEGHREPIDVWYGDQQHFGDPGEAQRWVNVLGTVATPGLASLSYSLNGGPEQALSVGPNGSRLQAQGDFNVELDYRQLDPSAADDHLSIRATYGNGDVFTHDVTIDYQDGQAWPRTYGIDWASVTDLQDVVQVVDGRWSFDASGVRPAEIGYDRVLNLGDAAWDNYQVSLTITPHDLSGVATGGAIWFGMQWGGHTDNPFGGQPHGGYIPGATFMLNGAAILRPSGFEDPDNPGIVRGAPILEEHSYNVLIRSEHVATDLDLSDGLDRTYSLKIWQQGTPEPADWLIQGTMTDQEPLGSFYLNAHYVDVTFGDIAVIELQGGGLLESEDALSALLAGSGSGARAAPAAAIEPDAAAGGPAAPIPNLADLVVSGDQPAA